jgi:hypothetical protein
MQSQPQFSNSDIGERYCPVVKRRNLRVSLVPGLPRLRTYVHVREACARQIVARRHVRGGPWGMGERVEIAPTPAASEARGTRA